jgi:hypothetical protein
METVTEALALIGRHIDRAVGAVKEDAAASPVLLAVVLELDRKSKKAAAALDGAEGNKARELVVELEQAADSANVAAAADPGLGAPARKLVELAHQSICLLKFESKG